MRLQQLAEGALAIFRETPGHGIEVPRQLRQLVIATYVGACVEVALADFARRLAERRDRLKHAPSEQG